MVARDVERNKRGTDEPEDACRALKKDYRVGYFRILRGNGLQKGRAPYAYRRKRAFRSIRVPSSWEWASKRRAPTLDSML